MSKTIISRETSELLGKQLSAKVVLHNYRYPKSKTHTSGEFAIVILDICKVISGKFTSECVTSTGGIVVSGNIPQLTDGMEYVFTGTLTLNEKWGLQYSCDSIYFAYNMDNKDDQKKFFSFFMTETQINTLFTNCENPMEILEQKNIGALTKIKGIGPATAHRMCEKYAENINKGRAYVELKDLGLTKNAIDGLILRFGSADAVVEIIKSNPYSLISLVRGYGWERADKIALRQGFGRGCKERCMAYTFYRLEKLANEDGSSRLNIDNFIDELSVVCSPTDKAQLSTWIKEDMVGVSGFEEYYKKAIKHGCGSTEKFPTLFYDNTNRSIGLFSLRVVERQIADELKRLKTSKDTTKYEKSVCLDIIHDVEREQGYEYTKEQIKAIWDMLHNNVSVLTGSGGTGKSSTLKPLIRIFKKYHKKVSQCALSGKASSLLTEYTDLEGKTIHRLLKYSPETEKFTHSANFPLPSDVVILDETSMVGEELFLSLISSIKTGGKLILLGDIKQLPPIAVGNILGDCIQSGYIPSNCLTVIHRQAMQSGIISQALEVCNGRPLVAGGFIGEEIRGSLHDFKLVAHEDASLVHYKVIEEFQRLYKTCKISDEDIQIVVPVRSKGVNSCRNFNREIQQIVNPSTAKQSVSLEVVDGGQRFDVVYRQGDRVMVTKNNYHAKLLSGEEIPVYNGNVGTISKIDASNMIINIFGIGKVGFAREQWSNIIHAWAITAHKLQGSQTPYAIVCLDGSSYPLLTREWLYTAITRSKKWCTLIGQPKAINMATRTSDIKIKQTWLKNDLHQMFVNEQIESGDAL